jgi:hypothetical protein
MIPSGIFLGGLLVAITLCLAFRRVSVGEPLWWVGSGIVISAFLVGKYL